MKKGRCSILMVLVFAVTLSVMGTITASVTEGKEIHINNPVEIYVESPFNGAVIKKGEPVSIVASAPDSGEMMIYVDEALVVKSYSNSISWVWNTKLADCRQHTVMIAAKNGDDGYVNKRLCIYVAEFGYPNPVPVSKLTTNYILTEGK